MVNSSLLREQINVKLKHLSARSRAIASQEISQKITRSRIFRQSQNIACYIPIENEVNTWAIIKTIWQEGKNCYIPACCSSPSDKYRLCFVKFGVDDKLLKVKNFKFLSPEIIPERIIAPEKLDLVVVPLVGFTSGGYRLGRGTGCYDRTFAFRNNPRFLRIPYLIGIGYKCQQVDFVPYSWDVAMDEIISA